MRKYYGVSLIYIVQAMDFLQQIHSFSYGRVYFLEGHARHSQYQPYLGTSQYLGDDEYPTSQSDGDQDE